MKNRRFEDSYGQLDKMEGSVDPRRAAAFMHLLGEFDVIHTCYHEAVEAFMAQLKQSASSEMTVAVRVAFAKVEELMANQTEMLKNSALTSTPNKNSDDR